MSQAPVTQTKPDRRVPQAVESQLVAVGGDLADRLRNLVEAIPGGPYRPQELAREMSLNKDLVNRLFRAINANDPLNSLSVVPGPGPLRQFVEAASQRVDNSAPLATSARTSINEFERLIRAEYGDRAALDAVISAFMPAMRGRFEATAKQEMYRAVARLRGVATDTSLVTFMAHPSRGNPLLCDTAMLGGYVGLRRIRPGAPIHFTSVLDESWPNRDSLERTDGSSNSAPLLTEFCSPGELPLAAQTEGERVRYSVLDNTIGLGMAMNVFLSEFYPENIPSVATRPEQETRWFYATVEQPSTVQVLDVFLHKSMWPETNVDLRIYDTAINGIVRPNDASREIDRLDLAETVTQIGVGTSMFRSDDVPRYIDMLEHVAGKCNWDLSEFRGYRCRIAYPYHGSQICLVFSLPTNLQQ